MQTVSHSDRSSVFSRRCERSGAPGNKSQSSSHVAANFLPFLTFQFVFDLKDLPHFSQGNGLSDVCTTDKCRVSKDFCLKRRLH
jgi:hypothetical protein